MAFTRFFFTDLPGHPSLNGLGSFGALHPQQANWRHWPAPDNYGGGNASGRNVYPATAMANYALTTHEAWLGATDGKIITKTGSVSGLPQYTRWISGSYGASDAPGGNPTYGWAVCMLPWARFSFELTGMTTVYAGNVINQSASGSPTNPWMLALAQRGQSISGPLQGGPSSTIWFPHCYVYRPSTSSIVGWIHISTFNYATTYPAVYTSTVGSWIEIVPGVTSLRYPYQSSWAGNVTGVQDGDLFVWEMFQILQWTYYSGGAIPAGGTLSATHDLEIMGPRIVGNSNIAPGLTYGGNGYPNFASNYVWANEVVNGIEPTTSRTTVISASLGPITGSTGLTVTHTP